MRTIRSLGIEALDGTAQSLPPHAGEPGGFDPSHALQGIGNRQELQDSPEPPLAVGSLA
ncbi:hypothetical protein ACFOYU_05005 [Microvirga sp. GCM10011540]|uniref:hypothetical protein n=1 Tax=Microvirga sp. GCM10011540 TaxID=3317338 RepID=UPI00361876C5